MSKINYTDKVIGSKWKAEDANEVKDSINAIYDGAAVLNQVDEIQDAKFSIGQSGHIGGYGVTETFVSPQITGHQGYTTDGTYHYITDTARIDKRNNDGSWSVALSNNSPFTGVTGVNHLGDCEYANGVLYIPAETYGGCGSVSGQKVLTFNPTTLALINQFDISAQGHEASAIAIDEVNNIAYISSYCDGTKLWKYNATTFAYLGVITLEREVSNIQGLSFYDGLIYIASELEGIYTCTTSGALTLVLVPENALLIPEGITVVGGQIRWLIDNNAVGTDSNVYFYDPTTEEQGFYTDRTGVARFGGELAVGRKLSVFTDSEIGTVNIGSKVGYPSALYLENGTNSGALTHDNNTTGLSRNAYIFAGVWTRSNIAKPSFSFVQNEVTNQFQFRSAEAGANPITWTDPMTIERASGKITVSNTTDALFSGTGSVANDQLFTIRNLNANASSSFVALDNTFNIAFTAGVMNSTSTLGASYGLAGEGFIRSSGASTGLHVSATAGPIRFSVAAGTEVMRIFASTRMTIGGSFDTGFKLGVIGTGRYTGTNAAPSTSGSLVNGALRLDATGNSTVALDAGVDGTNNRSWIQSRNPGDYTVNRELRLNPNGGGVLTGNKSSSADPTTSDIPAGMNAVWKNTTSGTIKLWTNDGGTMKSVALA